MAEVRLDPSQPVPQKAPEPKSGQKSRLNGRPVSFTTDGEDKRSLLERVRQLQQASSPIHNRGTTCPMVGAFDNFDNRWDNNHP